MDINVRPLKKEDLPALISIDTAVTNMIRESYYKRKLDEIFAPGRLSVSLVAEVNGNVVGFLLGKIYEGEYGIPEDTAYIDTLGIAPEFHKIGIGSRLMEQFVSNMEGYKISKVYTLVNFGDVKLMKFFASQGFEPSKRLNLELEII